MPVTNGTVEYSRMVRPADFEHQTFKVSYSFVVNEGEDHAAVTAEIADEAVAIVHGRLGLAAKAPAKAPVQETQEPKGKGRDHSAWQCSRDLRGPGTAACGCYVALSDGR
jgi:hypothetical protein